MRRQSQASYAAAIRQLATALQSRDAGLIIFGPLPFFPNRPVLATPLSLCQPEWYRPAQNLPAGCRPSLSSRDGLIDYLQSLNALLSSLENELPNLRVFRPFSAICPPDQSQCSTFRGDRMLFTDTNHLSREGVRLLEDPFLRFLHQQGLNLLKQRSVPSQGRGRL
ncbi:MAG: SGNH hydrolase domain-containing protein [Cyanobium sp.]